MYLIIEVCRELLYKNFGIHKGHVITSWLIMNCWTRCNDTPCFSVEMIESNIKYECKYTNELKFLLKAYTDYLASVVKEISK